MLLPELQLAWNQQKAAITSPYGEHYARGERYSGPGDIIGNEPFSFEEHDVADIDLFSMESALTGQLQVANKDPRNSISANVVLDIASADRNDPKWMTAAKRSMGAVLLEAFQESKPAYEDTVRLYVVGDTKVSPVRNAIELPRTADPVDKARAINNLEGDNLIVISSFSELNPASIKPRQRGVSKLGVKFNHPYEVALEADLGKWETGDPDQPVVNTKKPDELAAWNEKLTTLHLARMAQGTRVGISMVHLVCDLQYKRKGFFNPIDGDKALSRAFIHSSQLAARV
jgi:hypothetical protein